MGNEQQSGMSHPLMRDTSSDKSTQEEGKQNSSWTQLERLSPTKPSWQIARDISMDILSRKASRLSLKQGTLSDASSIRSQKHVSHRRSTISKPFKIYRIPRMPTDKEVAQIAISYESACSFCESTCVGDYIRCRVCTKTFHLQCLFQRGYITNTLPRLTKQDWNCPECNDLTRLLDQDELHDLINSFEQIDRDKDGYIILEEFLSFQSNKTISDGLELFIQYNYELGRKLFSLMDTTQNGVVAWSDFVLFYSCKLIAAKDKTKLTTKLTNKELVMAKKLFFQDPKKTFDNEYNIIITREYFNEIYKDHMQSLKKKYGIEFLDAILGSNDHIKEKSEKLSMMNWSEFLRELSLLILLNRSNDDAIYSQLRRASVPAHLSNASVVLRPRFSSVEINSSRRLTLSRSSNTPAIANVDISCDESFRKHAKILEKLNRQEEFKSSLMNYTIVENIDEEDNINLPKLKSNARDDRRTITDPWTSAKEIEQLRNQPILVKITRIKMLKT